MTWSTFRKNSIDPSFLKLYKKEVSKSILSSQNYTKVWFDKYVKLVDRFPKVC